MACCSLGGGSLPSGLGAEGSGGRKAHAMPLSFSSPQLLPPLLPSSLPSPPPQFGHGAHTPGPFILVLGGLGSFLEPMLCVLFLAPRVEERVRCET